jgi:hypothetical protein
MLTVAYTLCFPLCLALSIVPPTANNDSLLKTEQFDDSHHSLRLSRRQCEYDAQGNIQCDGDLPTLDQIIARMRSKTKGNVVTDDRIAVFYSNLDDPSLNNDATAREVSWVVGWLKANNFENRFYWNYEAIDMTCEYSFEQSKAFC